jgi:uncharacterized protein YndB with AHSA1/START domain
VKKMSNASYELSVNCYIEAQPARVWAVMTERLVEWWCPKPWSTEIIEQDWRAGGRTALLMRGPDGEESPMEGVFLEVLAEQRFVFTDAVDANWNPQGPFMVGIFEIAAEGSGTRYTASARHWNDEARKQHEAMGFEEGWKQVAAQLKALAEMK